MPKVIGSQILMGSRWVIQMPKDSGLQIPMVIQTGSQMPKEISLPILTDFHLDFLKQILKQM